MTTKKGLGIKIKVEEIDNGFTVNFFSEKGRSKYDKKVFCEKFENVLEVITIWEKKVKS